MDEFEKNIIVAGDALTSLAEGPGTTAANVLESVFATAGQNIERTLSQAARTGELDFGNMAEAVIADLARIAAEAVIANSGISAAGQTVNLNMSVGAGADSGSIIGAAGNIASAIAMAAARGGRFA